MRHELHTEIDIDATTDEVWRVLSDLAAYGDWSPFTPWAAGTLALGERLAVRLEPPDGERSAFGPP